MKTHSDYHLAAAAKAAGCCY